MVQLISATETSQSSKPMRWTHLDISATRLCNGSLKEARGKFLKFFLNFFAIFKKLFNFVLNLKTKNNEYDKPRSKRFHPQLADGNGQETGSV
jgi:hypothetical protein